MIEGWKTYLDKVIPQISQEHNKNVYPIEDWNPEEENRDYQTSTKAKYEKVEISKLLTTDWQIALDFDSGPGSYFHLFDQVSKERRFLIGEAVKTIHPTIERIINDVFIEEEIVLHAIHRLMDDPNWSAWPVADIIMFLHEAMKIME